MNAFVTGATGLLGNNLVRLLVAQGHRVSALVRDPAKAQRLLGDLDIATVQGDMLDVAGFAGHLAGVEVVYHAAAYFREYYQPGDHWPKLHAINVEGTQALLEAADAHGVRRFVHVSSGGVLERSDDRASDEHDRASDEHDRASDEHDRASDEHDRASDEHDRASDEHDRASDEHDRASDEHDRASDEHDRASDEHDRASDEHDRASDEHDRASDEHDRASDEHDRASDEHDRASDEHDRASDEHDRASDEHDRASDEHDRASGLALDNLYFRSKVETEKVIETFLARHDMPVVIILPGWMFGPGDAAPTSAGQLVLDFLNRNLPGIPTRGGGSVADARDVAAAMIVAAEHGVSGQRYVVGGTFHTLAEIAATLERASGVPAPRLRVPYSLLLTVAWVSETVARLRGRETLLTANGVRTVRAPYPISSSKAIRDLGASFRPIEETLRDTVDWYRSQAQPA